MGLLAGLVDAHRFAWRRLTRARREVPDVLRRGEPVWIRARVEPATLCLTACKSPT